MVFVVIVLFVVLSVILFCVNCVEKLFLIEIIKLDWLGVVVIFFVVLLLLYVVSNKLVRIMISSWVFKCICLVFL